MKLFVSIPKIELFLPPLSSRFSQKNITHPKNMTNSENTFSEKWSPPKNMSPPPKNMLALENMSPLISMSPLNNFPSKKGYFKKYGSLENKVFDEKYVSLGKYGSRKMCLPPGKCFPL